MKANNVSDVKSKKKSEVIQADNQDKSKEETTVENSAGDSKTKQKIHFPTSADCMLAKLSSVAKNLVLCFHSKNWL